MAAIQALMLDMDGVLFHGDKVIPAALRFMRRVSHLPHVFLTNNPVLTPTQVCTKLEQLGFSRPDAKQVITSGVATARYLNDKTPGFRYFAVGAKGLHEVLAAYGHSDNKKAQYVVVGEGAGLDYDSLSRGLNLIIRHGAKLISTNPDDTVDATLDGQHWILPGGGALVAAFETGSGSKALTIGKPEPLLYRIALEQLDCAAAHCLMIGDRPDTDIAGAISLGIQTALVRSGRFAVTSDWPESITKPDFDTPNLDTLYDAMVSHAS